MIKNKVIVSRYAEAFISLTRENCGLDKALDDLVIVKNIIRDNPGFSELMHNPEISYTEKCLIIDEAIRDGLSDEIRNFLKLLIEKNVLIFFGMSRSTCAQNTLIMVKWMCCSGLLFRWSWI